MTRFVLLLFDRPRLTRFLLVLLSVAAALGLSRLRFDDDYLNLIRSDASAFVALERSYADFQNEVHDLLIVVDAPDVVTIPILRSLRTFTRLLVADPGIASVVSVFDAAHPFRITSRPRPVIPDVLPDSADPEALKDQLTNHPMLADQLLDRDGTTTVIVASLKPHRDGKLAIDELDARLAAVRRMIAESGLEAHARVRLTGPPAIRSTTVKALAADQVFFATTALVLAVAVGWLFFRSAGVVAGVATPPVLGVLWTFGLMGLAGEPVNLINGTIAPLLMAITLTDTVHLVTEIRARRLAGADDYASVTGTLRKLAAPCALTSLTTAIGFGSLMTADIDLVRRFGAVCAAGVMLCLLAVLVLTPRWATTRLSSDLASTARVRSKPEAPAWLVATWRRPRPLLAITMVVFVATLVIATRLTTDVRATTELPRDSEAHAAFEHLELALGGMLSAQVVIRWPEHRSLVSHELWDVLAEVHKAISHTAPGAHPFSVLNIEAAARGSRSESSSPIALFALTPKPVLRRLVEPRNRSAVVYARMPDEGARALLPVLDDMNTRLQRIAERHPGFVLEQTGLLSVHVRTIDRLIVTLTRSLAVAVPVIFVTLTIAFRSVRLAAASLVPNGLPLAFIATYLVLSGGHVGIAGALSFTVALGIAVDDTIHFIDRYRRLREHMPLLEALNCAWSSLAGVMLITTAILAVGFGSLAFSRFSGLRYFSGLSCLALAIAVIGDLLVLPAWLAWTERSPRDTESMRG